jgi:predicted nucleotidyltransferase
MSKMIPKFDKSGNLPEGVHKAPLDEIKKTFGTSSARRKWLFDKLEEIIKLAKSTKKLERVIIWGSFVSEKEYPQDIDLLLIVKSDFILDKVEAETKKVFNYVEGRITFNADIFWVKSSIGEESINLFLETYQITRDFKTRGIVEVVLDDKK